MIPARFEPTFEGWRMQARLFLHQGLKPELIDWNQDNLSFDFEEPVKPKSSRAGDVFKVPPSFLDLAKAVCYARDPERWGLLYRILYRLKYEAAHLIQISVDPDIHRALLLRKSVRRDIHKMHAFVRFKQVEDQYIAWHKPEHFTLRPGAPFFARRFGDKKWTIFTPDESVHWDLKNLTFGPGIPQSDFKVEDPWDEIWKTYYKSIFNPARIKIKMMKAEMAPKYWSSLPEAALIRDLVREAPQRLQRMAADHNTAAHVDPKLSLPELKTEVQGCRACPIGAKATQAVFGQGPSSAKMMIVGEQPGEEEDLSGDPFVGPAGRVLLDLMKQTGLSREEVYITNAVKHFKWEPQGKLRIHQKPSGRELHACKPWLEAEIAQIRPEIILALGVTAGTAILGKLPKINQDRGKIFQDLAVAPHVIISWHPAAILRSFNEEEKKERMKQLRDDLKLAAGLLNPSRKVET